MNIRHGDVLYDLDGEELPEAKLLATMHRGKWVRTDQRNTVEHRQHRTDSKPRELTIEHELLQQDLCTRDICIEPSDEETRDAKHSLTPLPINTARA